jgi:hypothetical protein
MKNNELPILNKLKTINLSGSSNEKRKRSSILKLRPDNKDSESINSSALNNDTSSVKRKSVLFNDTKYYHYKPKDSPAKSPRKPKYSIDLVSNTKLDIQFSAIEKNETCPDLPLPNKFLVHITQSTKNNICINENNIVSNTYGNNSKYRENPRSNNILMDNIPDINIIAEESASVPGYIEPGSGFRNGSLFKNTEMRKNSFLSIASIKSLTQPKTKEEIKIEKLLQIIENPAYPVGVFEMVGSLSGFSSISFKNIK